MALRQWLRRRRRRIKTASWTDDDTAPLPLLVVLLSTSHPKESSLQTSHPTCLLTRAQCQAQCRISTISTEQLARLASIRCCGKYCKVATASSSLASLPLTIPYDWAKLCSLVDAACLLDVHSFWAFLRRLTSIDDVCQQTGLMEFR